MAEQLVGLIPAAGKGSRLGLPYPKELYPTIQKGKYKPVSQFVLENMTAAKIKDVVFVINETKLQLITYFGSGRKFNCRISYVVQENQPTQGKSPGLSEALDSAYHLTKGKTVVFGMADTIMRPLDVFNQLLREVGEDDVIMGLYRTDRPEGFGMVELDHKGRAIRIIDKPRFSRLEYMWGCMVWKPVFTDYLNDHLKNCEISDFAEVMNSAIKKGIKFRGLKIEDGIYTDIGTFEDIERMEREFYEK